MLETVGLPIRVGGLSCVRWETLKNWFPFTDYDFYAYLTGGFLLLFSLDYAFNSGAIMLRNEWPVVQIVVAVALAYVVGQLVAGPSAILLEHGVARRLLYPPAELLLGLRKPRARERFVQRWITGRDYAPLPEGVIGLVKRRAAEKLSVPVERITSAEEVFQLAFPEARRTADTATRLDQLRTLYGLSRNLAFTGAVCTFVFLASFISTRVNYTGWSALAAAVIAVGMYARFLKFYAGFTAEVLRTYAAGAAPPGGAKT